ncbi:cytochrome b [Rhodoferax sp.]|uniref:cytochrome b n=1 Tax=Rhodoferax sp. TaxID=50421 RepID=UPI0027518550|nr:cytochrome b [Rhodoferax sp.]
MSVALSKSHRYTITAIALHWLTALAIVGMLGLGWYMSDLPLSPERLKLYNWHKWAGVSLLGVSLVRLSWRWTHRPPVLPRQVVEQSPAWQLRLAAATHMALYGLLLAVPLIGWAYSSAAGFPVVVFGMLPLPDLLPKDTAWADLIKPLHALGAYTLCVLAVLHTAAAVKHQFVDQDGLMQRMWPARSAAGAAAETLP